MPKTNPRRIPVSKADLLKAKRECTNTALNAAYVLMFSVLRDKEGYDNDSLKRVHAELEDLADSIKKDYVNLSDLRYTLRDEAGIVFRVDG